MSNFFNHMFNFCTPILISIIVMVNQTNYFFNQIYSFFRQPKTYLIKQIPLFKLIFLLLKLLICVIKFLLHFVKLSTCLSKC